MEQTEIEIKVLKRDMDSRADEKTIENAVFVEDSEYLYTVTELTLRGKYNRVYTVVTDFLEIEENEVVVNDNLLVMCVFNVLVIIDVLQNKVIKTIKFDDTLLYGIYNFKSGYFVHGETINYLLTENFDTAWQCGCDEIFFNSKARKDLVVFDDYVVAFDSLGYKHYYNENGEFKTEYFPEYVMPK